MPKATHTHTTPSRRQILSGSILAALTGATVGAAIVLPNPSHGAEASPDAHLLTLCAEAMRLDQAAEDLHGAEEHATLRQWFVVAERIAATPALTPAGMQAKARIVLHLMEPSSRRPDTDDTKWDEAGIYGPLVWSLVNDMTAVA